MQAILRGNETIGFATDMRPRSLECECIETTRARRHAASLNKEDYVVQIADSDASRVAARQLVHDRYSARGYRVSNHSQESQHQTTIVVLAGRAVAGTATLRVDSPLGFGADAVFKDRVDVYRGEGARVCEMTRFALAPRVCSEIVLAAVFHFLYILAFHLQRCSHIFIEVNPRHRRFYETVFGFECRTEIRTNPRVNAPAYLLQVRTDHLATRIYYPSDDLTFPRFYSAREEQAIRASFVHGCPIKGPLH